MTTELADQLAELVATYTKHNEEKNLAGVLHAEIKVGQLIIKNIDLVAGALRLFTLDLELQTCTYPNCPCRLGYCEADQANDAILEPINTLMRATRLVEAHLLDAERHDDPQILRELCKRQADKIRMTLNLISKAVA